MLIRLQKFLAEANIASRRKSEEIILAGRVKVNGSVVMTLGIKVDEYNDVIEVDNKVVRKSEELIYILLNKPEGYVTTASDQFNRKTVLDCLRGINERVYPVGRLDYDTSGLLLLTNDGDLTYKLTHPKHSIKKTYLALLEGIPTERELISFRKGLAIEDYITSPAEIAVIDVIKGNLARVQISITEGKNRQVRKMCDAINHRVLKLKRVGIDKLKLGDLKKGEFRHLNKEEIHYLKSL